MRRMKTTAKPIKIAPSKSSGNSSDDDDRDRHMLRNGRKGFIIGNNRCDELNSGMDGMTVGSLPCVRRGRRSVVSSGGNEILFGGNTSHSNGNRWVQSQRQGNGRPNREMLATSMPVPHAPFLSSRRDYGIGNTLSSIPAMNLTMSAAESIESDSMTYGSLRESTFTRLNANSLNRVPYISDSTVAKNSGGCNPQLLPPMHICNKKNTINNGIGTSLQTKGCGGIASLFDGGDSTQSGQGTASGGMACECLPNEEGISNNNNNIGSLSPQDLKRTQQINSAGLIENINENNGMGSVLDNHDHVPSEVNPFDNNEDIHSGNRLGTSLTGLDILRLSQPGLVDLTSEQRESLQKRVRVMGRYDGPVSQSLSSDIIPSSTISFQNPPDRRQDNNNSFQPALAADKKSPLRSLLIPPRKMIQANETEDLNRYDDRLPSSPDDIFDMDE